MYIASADYFSSLWPWQNTVVVSCVNSVLMMRIPVLLSFPDRNMAREHVTVPLSQLISLSIHRQAIGQQQSKSNLHLLQASPVSLLHLNMMALKVLYHDLGLLLRGVRVTVCVCGLPMGHVCGLILNRCLYSLG